MNDMKKALQTSKAAMLLLATISGVSLVAATVTPIAVPVAATSQLAA